MRWRSNYEMSLLNLEWKVHSDFNKKKRTAGRSKKTRPGNARYKVHASASTD